MLFRSDHRVRAKSVVIFDHYSKLLYLTFQLIKPFLSPRFAGPFFEF